MKRFLIVLGALVLITAGCGKSAITVDGEGVSKEVFNAALKQRLAAHKGLNAKVDEQAIRKSVTDELVAELLLTKEAKAKKLSVADEEVQRAVQQMRGNRSDTDFREEVKKTGISYELFLSRLKTQILISKLMDSLVPEDSLKEEDMKEFYSKSQIPFLKPEKVLVKILQITAEADAKEATEKLKKGEDFDKLADSLAKSGKASSTDYGWLEPDTLPSRELAAALKNSRPNLVQGPFKGRDGSLYIFRIKERQASQVLSFEEAKPRVKATMLSQRRQELAGHIIESTKKKVKIKINIPVS